MVAKSKLASSGNAFQIIAAAREKVSVGFDVICKTRASYSLKDWMSLWFVIKQEISN